MVELIHNGITVEFPETSNPNLDFPEDVTFGTIDDEFAFLDWVDGHFGPHFAKEIKSAVATGPASDPLPEGLKAFIIDFESESLFDDLRNAWIQEQRDISKHRGFAG